MPSVVILGRPGSGNCLIRDLLQDAGVERPYVSHGWSEAEFTEPPTHVILTKRDETIRARSRALRKGADIQREEAKNYNAFDFKMWADKYKAKTFYVHYRDIVNRPEWTRMQLLSFAPGARQDTPWPRPIYDGDKKHLEKT